MDLENNLERSCIISQYWRNRLKNLEPVIKEHVDVNAFDLEETSFNFDDEKANEFFAKCQKDKIINQRDYIIKTEYKKTVLSFGK
jgi:hypothetical protein